MASRTGGFTPAHLKEAFAGAALLLAHERETALDRPFADAVLANVESLKRYISASRDPEELADARDPSHRKPGFGTGGDA